MKKMRIAFILMIACCLLTATSCAGFQDVFSDVGQTMTINASAGSQVAAVPFTGDFSLVLTGQGVGKDGRNFVTLTMPEEQALEDHVVIAAVKEDEKTWLETFEWVPGSGFISIGLVCTLGDIRVEYSGGYYDYSEGEVLYVRLPGSPYTGYEWTWIPDDSGTLEYLDGTEVDMTEGSSGVIEKTATGMFFEVSLSAPSRTGSVIFEQTAAPEGEKLQPAIRIDYILDENNLIQDFEIVQEDN